jgi:transcription elongation factor Elf1
MNVNTLAKVPVEIDSALLDAIRTFPRSRSVVHCGDTIVASPLAIYVECPKCGQRIKVRSFAGVAEVEDVFDAVFEWMNDPTAQAYSEQRRKEIADDAD